METRTPGQVQQEQPEQGHQKRIRLSLLLSQHLPLDLAILPSILQICPTVLDGQTRLDQTFKIMAYEYDLCRIFYCKNLWNYI
jgi:hypothetical protein